MIKEIVDYFFNHIEGLQIARSAFFVTNLQLVPPNDSLISNRFYPKVSVLTYGLTNSFRHALLVKKGLLIYCRHNTS